MEQKLEILNKYKINQKISDNKEQFSQILP